MPRRIVLITGEASGDIYGSLLAKELKALCPGIELMGVGGERMREAGVDTFIDSSELSVVGFWEAIVRLPYLRKVLETIKGRVATIQPDLLILIDYPGMNLRIAAFAKSRNLKVMYYVSPQIWAWGRNRIKMIRSYVDKMVVILPFEEEIYGREGIDVTYVGHPLIDVVKPTLTKSRFLEELGLKESDRLIALLPGSRHQEIANHLKPLLDTARLIKNQNPNAIFLIVTLPKFRERITKGLEGYELPYRIITDMKYDALAHSELVIASSGTATLEAALVRTPVIVIYKLSLLSWLLGRMIVKVPYISLVNLVAGRRVVPEFIQNEVKPVALAREAMRLLNDTRSIERMRRDLDEVRSKLGTSGATRRAAQIAIALAGANGVVSSTAGV